MDQPVPLNHLEDLIAHPGEALRLRFNVTEPWVYAVIASDARIVRAPTIGMPREVYATLRGAIYDAALHAEATRSVVVYAAMVAGDSDEPSRVHAGWFIAPGFQCEIAHAEEVAALHFAQGVIPQQLSSPSAKA